MNREQIRNAINGRPLTDFVALEHPRQAAKDFYICPVCGSGTGKKKTPGLKLYRDTNRVICFPGQCFTEKGEDTTGALRIIWKCDETEVFRRAGYSLDNAKPEHKEHLEHKEHFEQKESKPQADYTTFYREAHEALLASPEALEYLHKRGISDESINRFNLGYCAAWKHEKAPDKAPATRRIIIPRTAATYTARRIDKPLNEYEEQFTKQVQGRQKDLFNIEALEAGETPWIVEGELDCISLLQAGAEAVIGIGATGNTGRILEEAKKHPEKVYIIALDNDPENERGQRPGQEAQAKLAQEMQAAGLVGLSIKTEGLYLGGKDANEAFTKDREALGRLIAGIEGKAQEMKRERDEERRAELEKRTGAGMLDAFLQEAKTRDFEPIPTGTLDIDRATAGGFIRRTLVLLSGAPGLGKTALAQAITENIAKTGRDCLYLNLEMDRAQLLARSLSRIAWTEYRADISPLEIMRGYAWTDEQAEGIAKAAAKYRAEIAPRMIYNPDNLTNALDSVLQAMEAETMRVKAAGREAPIICLDYLNLVDAGERDATEGLKRVIFTLKDFAKRNNTVVIAITATNRASNKAGTVEMESGRDSSAVEYSGDMMLGLSYTAIEDRRKVTYKYEDLDENGNIEIKTTTETCELETIRRMKTYAYEHGEELPPVCNEVSVKVLKNRFGEAQRRAKLIFDGRHNLFTMAYYEPPEYKGKPWKQLTALPKHE